MVQGEKMNDHSFSCFCLFVKGEWLDAAMVLTGVKESKWSCNVKVDRDMSD